MAVFRCAITGVSGNLGQRLLAEIASAPEVGRIVTPAGQIHFTRYPYVMSTAKATRELSFRPTYSTAEALESCRRGWYNRPKGRG